MTSSSITELNSVLQTIVDIYTDDRGHSLRSIVPDLLVRTRQIVGIDSIAFPLLKDAAKRGSRQFNEELVCALCSTQIPVELVRSPDWLDLLCVALVWSDDSNTEMQTHGRNVQRLLLQKCLPNSEISEVVTKLIKTVARLSATNGLSSRLADFAIGLGASVDDFRFIIRGHDEWVSASELASTYAQFGGSNCPELVAALASVWCDGPNDWQASFRRHVVEFIVWRISFDRHARHFFPSLATPSMIEHLLPGFLKNTFPRHATTYLEEVSVLFDMPLGANVTWRDTEYIDLTYIVTGGDNTVNVYKVLASSQWSDENLPNANWLVTNEWFTSAELREIVAAEKERRDRLEKEITISRSNTRFHERMLDEFFPREFGGDVKESREDNYLDRMQRHFAARMDAWLRENPFGKFPFEFKVHRVLGEYFPSARLVVCYTRMIELVARSIASKLSLNPETARWTSLLYRIVGLHEALHAVQHVGLDYENNTWTNMTERPLVFLESLTQGITRAHVFSSLDLDERRFYDVFESRLPAEYRFGRLLINRGQVDIEAVKRFFLNEECGQGIPDALAVAKRLVELGARAPNFPFLSDLTRRRRIGKLTPVTSNELIQIGDTLIAVFRAAAEDAKIIAAVRDLAPELWAFLHNESLHRISIFWALTRIGDAPTRASLDVLDLNQFGEFADAPLNGEFATNHFIYLEDTLWFKQTAADAKPDERDRKAEEVAKRTIRGAGRRKDGDEGKTKEPRE